MNSLNSLALETSRQNIARLLANMMLHLQRSYRLSSMEYPPKAPTAHLVVRAGQNLAGMLILEIKNCTNYPVEQICISTTKLRNRCASFFTSKEFRQATKSYLCEWALFEAEKRQLDTERTGWLVQEVDYIANLALSPVGIVDIRTALTMQGWPNPLQFAPHGYKGPEPETLIEILDRLPEFLGVLDFVDETTSKAIFGMLPEAVVSPALYEDPNYEGRDSIEYLDTLHEALYDRFPSLEQAYEVEINDGSCKTVRVAEFEGELEPYGDYRLLVGTITFENSDGGDIYLAIRTPYMFRSVLLVSEEIANDTGPGVVRYIYDAYARVLSDEIGEWVDIDELEYGDENDDVPEGWD